VWWAVKGRAQCVPSFDSREFLTRTLSMVSQVILGLTAAATVSYFLNSSLFLPMN
jgi:hypothetical protein